MDGCVLTDGSTLNALSFLGESLPSNLGAILQ